MTLIAFIFLTLALLSVWIYRTPLLWGSLTFVSILLGILAGNITWVGLAFIIALALFWFSYKQKPSIWGFIALIVLSVCFKLKLLPGYYPVFITPKFALGLENSLVGLFPLALLVRLAKSAKDWKEVFKGTVVGLLGISLIASMAVMSGAIRWNFTLPSFIALRTFSNLILTSIPEEAFYRGFVQNTLCAYFDNRKIGKIAALLLTSILFSATHIFWAPNFAILGFTFLASLLYGSVYLYSEKIESPILCHFLLNLMHMVFFSYHT